MIIRKKLLSAPGPESKQDKVEPPRKADASPFATFAATKPLERPRDPSLLCKLIIDIIRRLVGDMIEDANKFRSGGMIESVSEE